MRSTMLALLIVALAARQAFAAETSDTINGMKVNCRTATSTPAAVTGGLDNTACQACVTSIGNLPGLTSQRMYACYDVCQNSNFVGVAPTTTGAQCQTCIETPIRTVDACKGCMNPTLVTLGSRQSCFDCLNDQPFGPGALAADQQFKRDAYYAACAQCSRIPDAAIRLNCYTCIKSPVAAASYDPTKQGILSWIELNPPAGSPPVVPRDNDFGACVFRHNQSYLVNQGSVLVEGQYTNCVPTAGTPDASTMTVSDCLTCMKTVEDQFVATPSYAAAVAPKSYACGDICQSAEFYPGSAYTAARGLECRQCVQDVPQPWACGNCMKSKKVTECIACVKLDPYQGNTSNYNWACGMCANLEDVNLRNLCMSCIQNQPGAGPANTNQFTETNICSCIDLVQNNSFIVGKPLTAMERTCFENFTKRSDTGVLLPSDPIMWGIVPATGVNQDSNECLDCMRNAKPALGLDKSYACHEVCQNPALVKEAAQGAHCSACVTSAVVKDPWVCKACMIATNVTAERQSCFNCVQTASTFSNQPWGCTQCALLTTANGVRSACYTCMQAGVTDPNTCLDRVKNGTLTG